MTTQDADQVGPDRTAMTRTELAAWLRREADYRVGYSDEPEDVVARQWNALRAAADMMEADVKMLHSLYECRYEPCRCCGGSGVQTRWDGIKVRCPCCGGTGQWMTTPIVYEPWPPWHSPWFTSEVKT